MRMAGGMLMQSGVGRGRKSAKLSDFDIEYHDSKRWQALARIDEDLIAAEGASSRRAALRCAT
jgi:hypothetical protein